MSIKTGNPGIDRIFVGGRQPCCGATNKCCGRPPGVVVDYGTGCETCGHDSGCHGYWWAAS